MSGRPTKFRSEYSDLLLKHFDIAPYYEINEQKRTRDGWFYNKAVRKPNLLPTFFEFAELIGVSRDTLSEWSKEENEEKYPGFSVAYRCAKGLQKCFLIQNGLLGLYPSRFAIFITKAITRMK